MPFVFVQPMLLMVQSLSEFRVGFGLLVMAVLDAAVEWCISCCLGSFRLCDASSLVFSCIFSNLDRPGLHVEEK